MASSFTQHQVALCRTCSCLVSRLTPAPPPPLPCIQTPTGRRIRGRRSVDPRCALQNIRELVYSVPHSRSASAVSNKGKSITLAGPTNVAADLRKCMSAWKMDSANSSMMTTPARQHTIKSRLTNVVRTAFSVHHSSLLGSWINIFV